MCGSYVGHCYGKLNINSMQQLQLSKVNVMQATQVSESIYKSKHVACDHGSDYYFGILEILWKIIFQSRWMRPLTFYYVDDQLISHDELILLEPRPSHGTIEDIVLRLSLLLQNCHGTAMVKH